MALSRYSTQAIARIRDAGAYLGDLVTPTVRIGVTGLARSGKTVFITALVRNLVAGGRLPFFGAAAERRIVRAYLEPQPDDDLPRFTYEDHLAALSRSPPEWPESTRRVSQLRVTIEYVPTGRIKRTLGLHKLHVDIVDYPGEWLIDLPMMELSFAAWSQRAVDLARAPNRRDAARAWLSFADTARPTDATRAEDCAREGARLFTEYLHAARDAHLSLSVAGPGRFLMPGDLEGSPLLTFFPLPTPPDGAASNAPLTALLERRYESYKSHVVRPFFREHFSRLDRQIVLVDVLSAINGGVDGLADLEQALTAVLQAFRPGAGSWLFNWLVPRIDRIAFAATKADHLHSASHDRLQSLLGIVTDRAANRASAAGARISTLAIAALRATAEAQVTRDGERLDCLVGVPLPGEIIGAERFDGSRSAAIFPGDLPTPSELAAGAGLGTLSARDVAVVRFRPPRIAAADSGALAPWPHIRLDRALEVLIGDHLT